MKPYVGITDFTSEGQVEAMLSLFQKVKPRGMNRVLHAGVMMSRKTLLGIETKWSEIFPPKETIASIFGIDSEDLLNCLHYADYTQSVDLARELSEAIYYGGIGIQAVQLDMVWPDPGMVADAVHRSRKRLEVILQIGERALDEAHNNPPLVAEMLADYEDVIHRVLLDKNMGRGKGLDAEFLLPFLRAIREKLPKLGLVVAGGLGPETLHLVEPLVKELPDLSIDAQGKLRPSGDATDPVDWRMAGDYLVKAVELFSQYEGR